MDLLQIQDQIIQHAKNETNNTLPHASNINIFGPDKYPSDFYIIFYQYNWGTKFLVVTLQ